MCWRNTTKSCMNNNNIVHTYVNIIPMYIEGDWVRSISTGKSDDLLLQVFRVYYTGVFIMYFTGSISIQS